MPVQVACPRCDFVLQRNTNESPPTHCPACGSRLTCPRCGSALSRDAEQTQVIHCTQCQFELGGAETGLANLPSATHVNLQLAIPGFELRGEVGRGGMGIVYRAYQPSLKRHVAIKVLPPALAADPELLHRFRNEAAVAGGLVESHILPVFAIEETQGVPIIVMPLIEGRDLSKIIRARLAVKAGKTPKEPHPWADLDDKAYLARVMPVLDQVVAAVAVLHKHEVLHRDIKPSNVLVDWGGNSWLSDFGLARKEWDGLGTKQNLGMGTVGYASPEQTRGADEIDYRSDLFSLGVTIYQALTLEMPYGKSGPKRTSPPPVAPRSRQRLLSRDFDTVLMKALEVDPRSRYQSATEVREDWQLIREGELPKHAKRARLPQRLARSMRRNWVVVTTTAAMLGMLGVLVFLPPRDQRVYRTVHVQTEPANARVILVPLDPLTGLPVPEKEKWIRPQDGTPLTIRRVPPGEYLIEAQVAGHGFHEVYRTVPQPNEKFTGPIHRDWTELSDGTIKLPTISIPSFSVTHGMASFTGGQFTMGNIALVGVPPHQRWVEDFYLDPTEVTIGEYFKFHQHLPRELEGKGLPATRAVSNVTFDEAVAFAESIGKRLPSEDEYEFAATAGGSRNFPWGDDPNLMKEWTIGPVGRPAIDKIAIDPPVYGLFSNVVEWTTSGFSLYPGADPRAVDDANSLAFREIFTGARVVRGGPPWICWGRPEPKDPRQKALEFGTQYRYCMSRDSRQPGLGFRCARSAKPRFLD